MNEQFPHLVSLSTQYTILYVEDDSDTQEEVARTLHRLFKEVYLASDGEEGLAKFKQYAPSLVMSDIQMPRKNGLEMVSAIKEIAPDTPVVIATAFNDERFFIKAIECGIDAFLLKPIDKQKLYQTLLKIVERMQYKEQTQELERLRMLTQINQASEESIKNLANLFPFPALFYQNDALIFINTIAGETLSTPQMSAFGDEHTFLTTFNIKGNERQKIKLPTTQGLHKIFWVYPNTLYIGREENPVHAYIFVDITLLEYQKLKLSNYTLWIYGMRYEAKENRVVTIIPEETSAKSNDVFFSQSDQLLLRKSHLRKITAQEYVQELGSDYNHELDELSDTHDDLKYAIFEFQDKKEKAHLVAIANDITNYAKTMEALFEFKDLGYTLRNLALFLNTLYANEDTIDIPKISILLLSLSDDLASWHYNIFIQKNAFDIHYLDSSLLSSCLQIEALFSGGFDDTFGDDLELF